MLGSFVFDGIDIDALRQKLASAVASAVPSVFDVSRLEHMVAVAGVDVELKLGVFGVGIYQEDVVDTVVVGREGIRCEEGFFSDLGLWSRVLGLVRLCLRRGGCGHVIAGGSRGLCLLRLHGWCGRGRGLVHAGRSGGCWLRREGVGSRRGRLGRDAGRCCADGGHVVCRHVGRDGRSLARGAGRRRLRLCEGRNLAGGGCAFRCHFLAGGLLRCAGGRLLRAGEQDGYSDNTGHRERGGSVQGTPAYLSSPVVFDNGLVLDDGFPSGLVHGDLVILKLLFQRLHILNSS